MKLLRNNEEVRNVEPDANLNGIRIDEVRLYGKDIEYLYNCTDEQRKMFVEKLVVRLTFKHKEQE